MNGLVTHCHAIGHFRQRHNHLPASPREQRVSLRGIPLPDILFAAVQQGELAQTHYVFPASNPLAFSIQVNLQGAEGSCQPDFEAARNKCSIAPHRFPYGLTEPDWWRYCLAPHSYVSLAAGQCQVGFNLFNRFLHLDLNQRSAQLVDPGVGNEMLSTTNWFDPKTGELWFASWPVEATVRRMLHSQYKVHVRIWRFSVRDHHLHEVWQGDFADSLHQLSVSADRRFLILTEMGLQPADPAASTRKGMRSREIIPSGILVLDLKTGHRWRLPVLTAAHVEFDPADPEVCYLSEHNIGLFGVKVGIFGPGRILKFRLKQSGPELLGQFTAPAFHRITTHIVFRHREKILIGVTGYPHTVFLIDAATMELYLTLEMDPGEKVDTAQGPHLCQQDSYGIGASKDGEAIFVTGTGFVRMVHVAEGRFCFEKRIDGYGAGSHFTGHLGMLYCTSGPKG
jgi:hypothetical protein